MNNLLSTAIYRGFVSCVQLFLNDHIRNHAFDRPRELIHCAIDCPNSAVLKLLLEEKVSDVNSENVEFVFPICHAIHSRRPSMVELLLDNGSRCDVTIYSYIPKERTVLLDTDIENNSQVYVTGRFRSYSMGPVTYAVYHNDFTLTKVLLDHKFGVIEPGVASNPLTIAIRHRNTDIARLLLENGAMVNDGKKEDRLPLFEALVRSSVEMVQLLVENGADVNIRRGGFTPLKIAEWKGEDEKLQFLTKHGAGKPGMSFPSLDDIFRRIRTRRSPAANKLFKLFGRI